MFLHARGLLVLCLQPVVVKARVGLVHSPWTVAPEDISSTVASLLVNHVISKAVSGRSGVPLQRQDETSPVKPTSSAHIRWLLQDVTGSGLNGTLVVVQ